MSVDTTFKPLGNTTLVGVAAVQLLPQGSSNVGPITVRVRCLVTAYLTWGGSAVVSNAGPVAGTPAANTIGMTAGAVEKLEINPGSFFISNIAAAFEVTPGMGGN